MAEEADKYEMRLRWMDEFDGPSVSAWDEITKEQFIYRKNKPEWTGFEFRALREVG